MSNNFLEKYDTDDDISSLEEFFEYELERTWQRELLEIKKESSHKKLSDTMENTVNRLKSEEK